MFNTETLEEQAKTLGTNNRSLQDRVEQCIKKLQQCNIDPGEANTQSIPIDGALGVFVVEIKIILLLLSTSCGAHTSPNWWTKVVIFIWFELRTPSAPSVGSHPSMLVPCYWLTFFALITYITPQSINIWFL